jgi:mono/diheme cytochrome c family protein
MKACMQAVSYVAVCLFTLTVLPITRSSVSRAADAAIDTKAGEEIAFDRDVLPVLRARCVECHGPDVQESGLRIDSRQALLTGGDFGPAVVPGEPTKTEILRRMAAADPDERMPPDGEPLSAAEIAAVSQWVAGGAVWPGQMGAVASVRRTSDHWAFQPLAESFAYDTIDSFLAAELTMRGLSPSPPADRRTLIRRLSLDLTGLPPVAEEVEAFVADERPQAVEALVDRLLASPRYGERWAQHWLDVIRYADTRGYEYNTVREHAWPYRDWVIDALNNDLPYDQFLFQQIAGDTVGVDPATGFLVTAPLPTPPEVGQEPAAIRQARLNSLDEVVQNVGAAVLGLTVGCARCHNHKFDPISSRDYHRLVAVFSGVRYEDRPWRRDDDADRVVFAGKFTEPEPVYLLLRGDPAQPTVPVGPGGLDVLGGVELAGDTPEQDRRVALARWLVGDAAPLVARAIVNRVWHHHFGTGLVATTSDFGMSGERPSHPALLDWLARRLIDRGWSLKSLHRDIVMSAAYRQSSGPVARAVVVDPDSRLVWRYPPQRLDAESIRDAMLSAAGVLDLSMGGPGVITYHPKVRQFDEWRPLEDPGPASWRRMIYLAKMRGTDDGMFKVFDLPDCGQVRDRRGESTTPLQALNLMNGPFTVRTSEKLAERLRREAGDEPPAQIDRLFTILFSRPPTLAERQACVDTLQSDGLETVCRAAFNANEFLFRP